MILRRGVPHLLLVLTVLLSGAGAWEGHELGPDGREKRAAEAYRAKLRPLMEQVEVAVQPLTTLSSQDPYTRTDVLLHGGGVQDLRSARDAIARLRVPGVLHVSGQALSKEVARLADAVDQLVHATKDSPNVEIGDDADLQAGFEQVQVSSLALPAKLAAVFGEADATEVAHTIRQTATTYLLDVDPACRDAQFKSLALPLQSLAQLERNATGAAELIEHLAERLRATPITGPMSGRTAALRAELTGAGGLGPALRELANAARIKDGNGVRHARARLDAAARHSAAVATVFHSLGATWCNRFFAVDTATTPQKT